MLSNGIHRFSVGAILVIPLALRLAKRKAFRFGLKTLHRSVFLTTSQFTKRYQNNTHKVLSNGIHRFTVGAVLLIPLALRLAKRKTFRFGLKLYLEKDADQIAKVITEGV